MAPEPPERPEVEAPLIDTRPKRRRADAKPPQRPRKANSRTVMISLAVGLCLAVAIAIAAISGPGGLILSTEKRAVMSWFDQNANEPDIQIVKWMGPIQNSDDARTSYIRLRFRVAGPFGRQLRDYIFVVKNGEAKTWITEPRVVRGNWRRIQEKHGDVTGTAAR